MIPAPIHIARRIAALVFERSLYLMWVPDRFGYFQLVKPGISGNPKARRREVATQSGMNVRLVAHFPLPAARYWESVLLKVFPFFADVPDHAGKREWRKFPNVVSAALVWLLFWAYDIDGAGVAALAVLFGPVPADAFLVWLIVILLSYTIAGAVVFAAGWMVLQIV